MRFYEVKNESISMQCAKTPPPAAHYFETATAQYKVFIGLSIIFSCAVLIVFSAKLYFIFHYVSSYRRAGFMIWMAGLFPITAIISTISICVPRAMAISNMFTLLYFSRSLFTFVELIIDYFGGRVEMAKELAGNKIKMNMLPCCCCCFCLPELKPSPRNLRRLGTYVYQAAMINPALYFIGATAWLDQLGEDINMGDTAVKYVLPVLSVISFASTMTAMYGTNLYVRMSAGALQGYCVITQVRFMQIMLLLYNMQSWIFTCIATRTTLIDCDEVLPEDSKAALYDRFTLVVESFILSVTSAYLLRPQINATFDLHPKRAVLRRKPAFSFSDPRPLHRVRGSSAACFVTDDSYYYHENANDISQLPKPDRALRKRPIKSTMNGNLDRKLSEIQKTRSASVPINNGIRNPNMAIRPKFSEYRVPESIPELEEDEKSYKAFYIDHVDADDEVFEDMDDTKDKKIDNHSNKDSVQLRPDQLTRLYEKEMLV